MELFSYVVSFLSSERERDISYKRALANESWSASFVRVPNCSARESRRLSARSRQSNRISVLYPL